MKLRIIAFIAILTILAVLGCNVPGSKTSSKDKSDSKDKTKSSSNNTNNTDLKNFNTNQGLLQPQYSNDIDVYTLKVDENTTQILVSCSTDDVNASLKIENQSYGNHAENVEIALSSLTNSSFTILITTEDQNTRVITIIIKKTKVYEGDYTIKNEEDAEGLRDYTIVTGTLNILNANISNVHTLIALEEIGGNLIIEECSNLADINGFANLTDIGGSILLEDNSSLTSFNMCTKLTTIGGILSIKNDNKILTTISFPALNKLGGFYITQSNALTTIDMPNLKEVTNNITIDANGSISQFNVQALEQVGGHIDIFSSVLTQLNIEKCRTIGDYIEIDNCAYFTTIILNSLESVGNDLIIYRCNAFTGQLSCPNLKRVNDELRIEAVPGITRVSCESLQKVGRISIEKNDNLVSVSLPNCTIASSRIDIDNNPKLNEIILSSMLEPGLYCNIVGNTELSVLDLSSFENDFTVMSIINADKLITLSIPNMHSIDCLTISDNDVLVTISLPKLTQVGSFSILDNVQLKTVTTGYITVMDDTLEIVGNPVLENIDFIHNLKSVVDEITIMGNTSLKYVDLNYLVSTRQFIISENNNITNIYCNSLQNLSKDLLIADNNNLVKAEFKNLIAVNEYFMIRNNDILSQIEFNKLKTIVVCLSIKDNFQLPTQTAYALRDQLNSLPPTVEISGNK